VIYIVDFGKFEMTASSHVARSRPDAGWASRPASHIEVAVGDYDEDSLGARKVADEPEVPTRVPR